MRWRCRGPKHTPGYDEQQSPSYAARNSQLHRGGRLGHDLPSVLRVVVVPEVTSDCRVLAEDHDRCDGRGLGRKESRSNHIDQPGCSGSRGALVIRKNALFVIAAAP